MEKYFYFFDLNEVLVDRYPAAIAKEISNHKKTDKFVFVYAEKYFDSVPRNIPKGSKFFFLKNLSVKELNEIISKYPPKSLTTVAQRIPDMWMLSFFNHKEIPTFIVQHGLWSDKLQRLNLIPLLSRKLAKFRRYVRYTNLICKTNGLPFSLTMMELYLFLLKQNIKIPDTRYLANENLRAKKAFVFDESWNDYYIHKYGYGPNDLIYIGNPDFLLLKDRLIEKSEHAVCYLCQSLVEDGRYSLKDYKNFLHVLNEYIAPKIKLYIKLHPRSKREHYSVLTHPNIVISDDFPICKYYIAHYTGLLATARQCSDNIFIWKLKGHHMPEYFLQYGAVVSDKIEDLIDFIDGKTFVNENQTGKSLSIRELKSFDPIGTIATNIIKYSL